MKPSESSFALPSAPSPGAVKSLRFLVGTVLVAAASFACSPAVEPAESPETANSGADPAAAAEASVPEIVGRALQFHGSEMLEQSNVSLTVTSKSGSFGVIAQPGPVFDYTIFSGSSDNSVVTRHTNKPGEPELTVTEGDQPVEISDPQVTRDFVSARMYFLFFPYRLLDPDTTLTDLGMETWGSRELHKVRLTFASGTSTNADQGFLFWFDPETAQLQQFAYTFDGGVRFRKMVNARRVAGVLIADHENYAHDENVSVNVVTPEFASGMKLLSTVALSDVSITAR